MMKHEFFHSTPKDVTLRIKNFDQSHKDETERLEYHSWLTGLFVRSAVASVLNKKAKYPRCPIHSGEVQKGTGKQEMSEEKKQKMRELLLMQLQTMQINFENNHDTGR